MKSCNSQLQVAVVCDVQCVGDQQRYTIDRIPIDTTARVIGAIPVLLPPIKDALGIDTLLAQVDGVFISGGLTNIHPGRYHRKATARDEPFDDARDNFVLPLINAVLDNGIPLLATCRGFQELNVSLGGSLRNEPDDLPEERKHGTPMSASTEDERYRLRHEIRIAPGGILAKAVEADTALVNSLHSQLIDRIAPALQIEAIAPDDTIEAARVTQSKGFALGVMFHPEYWAENDPASARILNCFSAAVKEFAAGKRRHEAAE
jgi:putative glutamine amidotransferase